MPAPDERPNILWLVSEDNSPMMVGAYGHPAARTPTLDRLAAEGIVFDQVYSNAPVCAIARSTLLTGMYPASTGMIHMRGRVDVPAWLEENAYPNRIRAAGYFATNNAKTDYNVTGAHDRFWDEQGGQAHYRNRPAGQPFFAIFNTSDSHESRMHVDVMAQELVTDPASIDVPPYHPDLPEIRRSWAHYFDRVAEVDRWVGERLAELEALGEADNTIVVYYSDHGGVIARSKRFLYDTGTHVPLIVYAPPKWRHLLPAEPGARISDLVAFVDMAPSVLNLIGAPIPEAYQGTPFLGDGVADAGDGGSSFWDRLLGRRASARPVYLYRDRMDERYDMKRGAFDGEYRYIRNYMPDRPNGQYIEFLFRAQATRAWREAVEAGGATPEQRAFWEPSPSEELYHTASDPWEVRNLAGDPAHRRALESLRAATDSFIMEHRDAGFIPEDMMDSLRASATIYDLIHSNEYPQQELMRLAGAASSRDPDDLKMLMEAMKSGYGPARFWGALGVRVLGANGVFGDEAGVNTELKALLAGLLDDPWVSVRAAAAEALVRMGETGHVRSVFSELLDAPGDIQLLYALNALSFMDLQPEDQRALRSQLERIARDETRVIVGEFGYARRIAAHVLNVWDGNRY